MVLPMALGALLMVLLHDVEGHAFLAEPPSRNVVAYTKASGSDAEYCPHCLQAGGPGTVSKRGEAAWPTINVPKSHGLCGDPVQGKPVDTDWRKEKYLVPTPIQRTYRAGDIAEFRIGVSTHHRGHYEFRICDQSLDGASLSSREDGQACLNRWLLHRAPVKETCLTDESDPDCQPIDINHPERWYLPPTGASTQQAGTSWQDSDARPLPSVTEVHTMRYQIPADLSCTHCTLQWYWSTGNTCLYDGDYFKYFERPYTLGSPSTQWCNFCTPGATCQGICCGAPSGKFAEEFWNCADVAVLPSDAVGSGVEPSPSSAPTPSAQEVSDTEAESETEPETEAPSATPPGPCAQLWGQCGGDESWSGPTCCESGTYCKFGNTWYSQCVEGQPVVSPAETSLPPVAQEPTSQPSPSHPTCSGFCDKRDLTDVGGCSSQTNSSGCLAGFVTSHIVDDIAVLCSWHSCGCYADGENILKCPDLRATCMGSLGMVQRRLRGNSRNHGVQRHEGAALIQSSHKTQVARTDGVVDEADLHFSALQEEEL